MTITEQQWKDLKDSIIHMWYTILDFEFSPETDDDYIQAILIAWGDHFDIRIKIEDDELSLDLDDEDTNFGSYYQPVIWMDPLFFMLVHDAIIKALPDRYPNPNL